MSHPSPSEPYVFLVGPYRAHTAGRQTAFEEICIAGAALAKLGISFYAPVALHHHVAITGGLDPDGDRWFKLNEPFLRSAAAVLVVKLSGWEESAGVKAELDLSRSLGIEHFYTDLGSVHVPHGMVSHLDKLRESAVPTRTPRTAAEFCAKAAELLDGDRALSYGDKIRCHSRIAALWSAYLGERINPPIQPLDAALMLALLKVGRLAVGSPTCDSAVDLAAYGAITGEIIAHLHKGIE